MSDQEKKQQSTGISPELDAKNKKQSTELSDEELSKVSGGDISIPYTKIEYTNTTQK